MLNTILGFVPDIVKGFIGMANKECQIKLAPEFHPSIPYPMNGGNMQKFANFQIRFGSETNLELIDAALFIDGKMIKCEQQQDAMLNGGRDWNSFNFSASELVYIQDKVFKLKIRVADHQSHCCELSSEMQMKQFLAPQQFGVRMGRWEIQPKRIFKIKCSRRKKF